MKTIKTPKRRLSDCRFYEPFTTLEQQTSTNIGPLKKYVTQDGGRGLKKKVTQGEGV